MMKRVMRLLIIVVMVMPMLLSGIACTAKPAEGFAIYLTADDVPVERMPVLSHVETAAEPLISEDDIISYSRSTHEITLKPDAGRRLEEMQFPVDGTSFLVCVDKGPIYWGAFWPFYSSLSFDGVVIHMPVTSDDYTISIELGYPCSSFFRGEDPRDNPLIMRRLEDAAKLIP